MARRRSKRLPTLAPVTRPWRSPITRRHRPQTGSYRTYRPCLRWEHGFSCVFCLVHEADIAPVGVAGFGVTGIEHFVPQSREAALRDVYENCFYACMLCNTARGKTPNTDPSGRELLNPEGTVWAQRLMPVGMELEPRDQEDLHVTFTTDVYDLNDRRKVRLRRLRRETIKERARFLKQTLHKEDQLLDLAETTGDPKLVDKARDIHRQRLRATRDLARFLAVPRDKDRTCRCGDAEHHSLPGALEEQTWDLMEVLVSRR